MTERLAQATDEPVLLSSLPVNVHASGIGPEGQAIVAAVRSGAVEVSPVVPVHFEPVNTDGQALKN